MAGRKGSGHLSCGPGLLYKSGGGSGLENLGGPFQPEIQMASHTSSHSLNSLALATLVSPALHPQWPLQPPCFCLGCAVDLESCLLSLPSEIPLITDVHSSQMLQREPKQKRHGGRGWDLVSSPSLISQSAPRKGYCDPRDCRC